MLQFRQLVQLVTDNQHLKPPPRQIVRDSSTMFSQLHIVVLFSLGWCIKVRRSTVRKILLRRLLRSFLIAYMHALGWWRERARYFELGGDSSCSGNVRWHSRFGFKGVNFKAVEGRGRKRATWVSKLYKVLLKQFQRMKAWTVKNSPAVILTMALPLVGMAPDTSAYHKEFTWMVSELARRELTGGHTASCKSTISLFKRRQGSSL